MRLLLLRVRRIRTFTDGQLILWSLWMGQCIVQFCGRGRHRLGWTAGGVGARRIWNGGLLVVMGVKSTRRSQGTAISGSAPYARAYATWPRTDSIGPCTVGKPEGSMAGMRLRRCSPQYLALAVHPFCGPPKGYRLFLGYTTTNSPAGFNSRVGDSVPLIHFEPAGLGMARGEGSSSSLQERCHRRAYKGA